MKATIEYIAAIEEIAEATKSGKIKWVRNRPDSFKYKTMNDDLEDMILNFNRFENDYLLTLEKKDFESTEVILNLDTSTTDAELRSVLLELYETIEYHIDLRNLDHLNAFVSLIKSPNKTDQLFT
ncbi:MAG: hypothetical protein JJ895_11340 [Balneolaceae bacterium]|nr:hypothetical protein [Balneolaceae bacterium]